MAQILIIVLIASALLAVIQRSEIAELRFRNAQLRLELDHKKEMISVLDKKIEELHKPAIKVPLTGAPKKEQNGQVRRVGSYREIRKMNEAENYRILAEEEKRKNDTDYEA